MNIRNAYVFGDTAQFARRDICVSGQYIIDGSSDGPNIDATDLYAIPGLIDLHFHGCVGEDISDGSAEGLAKMCEYQASHGITAICPATVTLPEDVLAKVCRMASEFEPGSKGASLVGLNLEGPFISPNKTGAQNPAYVGRPDVDMVRRLQEASGGLVKLLAIAPEQEGALDLIRALSDDIVCSIAHTTADYDTAVTATQAGAKHVTHLYNAMPPFLHREPGVIGAAFDDPDCHVELITDGVHIHPCVVRATFAMFGDDRVILVSDSMRATGLADGLYTLGELPVRVEGNRATLVEGGNLAGSATNLMDCLRTAVKMGIPLESAVRCATMNPARSLGIDQRYGSLVPGKIADIILLDEDLEIKQIILRGTPLL